MVGANTTAPTANRTHTTKARPNGLAPFILPPSSNDLPPRPPRRVLDHHTLRIEFLADLICRAEVPPRPRLGPRDELRLDPRREIVRDRAALRLQVEDR